MGSNISDFEFKHFLERNYCNFIKKTKHEHWLLKVVDDKGNIVLYRQLKLNMHVTKGGGMNDYTLKQVAAEYFLTKQELIEKIKNKDK